MPLPPPFADFLDEAASNTLGLYLHFPFCRRKCAYCSFVSGPPHSEKEMDRYVQALSRHLALGAEEAQGKSVATVYLGGGTPSLLGADRLARILEAINRFYNVAADAEITVEANPESASLELFLSLRPLGLNRVSLGAQSFWDDELKQLGRIHSNEDIRRAVDGVRGAGIANLSLDLIFAIPGQSPQRWETTLLSALNCEPDHLSAYGLSFEEGTLFERLRQEGKITQTLDETYNEMYDLAASLLAEAGMRHYEISNWHLPGKKSRHNLRYWDRSEYLAFGVSAHGFVSGRRYGLIADREKYVRLIEESGEKHYFHSEWLEESAVLSNEEMASDAMIFGLRKIEGVAIDSFKKRFGFTPLERWGDEVDACMEKGWLEQIGGRLRLTRQALLISNEVFSCFLD
ncbi:MAG: radical SAM family heme chaperone HemW [Candidatus Omnitrophota bacterium]